MTLPLTQMLCIHGGEDCTNASLVSWAPSQHRYCFVGDLILSNQGSFALLATTGGIRSLDLDVGWMTGGGPTGSGPDYGVSVFATSTDGTTFMTGLFGPLTTPFGTQFHIEIRLDTRTPHLMEAYENGVALTRYSYFAGGSFDVITPTRINLQYGSLAELPYGCVGSVALYSGTTTPTGSPYVSLAIPPGGTPADFLSNAGGIAGPFTYIGAAPHLCDACFDVTPPEPTLERLAMDDVVCTVEADQLANLISLRWSDDRGHSYGSLVSKNIGAIGQYRTSLQWLRLGYARDRMFEVSWSVPMPTALKGCWFDAAPGQS